MGFFVIFLFVAGIVAFLIKQQQNNVRDEWTEAAGTLRLRYSGGGLWNPHWLYGRRAGLKIDVKSFQRSNPAGGRAKWTGYRVNFPAHLDLRIRAAEDLRNQLTKHFAESEIDAEGVFCARSGVDADSRLIVNNVHRVTRVAERLLAIAEEESLKPPPVNVPVPGAEEEQVAPIEAETGAEEGESDSEAMDAPIGDAVDEPLEAAAEAPVHEVEPEVVEVMVESSPEFAPGAENEPSVLELEAEEPEPLITLGAVSKDLFDSGRNRFQITQRFDAEYNGLSMIGDGKLRRAETWSNDRVFGRGPGVLVEVEIYRPEETSIAGHHRVHAVVQLPEETHVRELRQKAGEPVTISGTMVRCDAFDGKIFLSGGELA